MSQRRKIQSSRMVPGQKGLTDYFLLWFPGTNSYSCPIYFSNQALSLIDNDQKLLLKKVCIVYFFYCHI